MGYHPAKQHINYWSPRKEKEVKGAENLFQEIIAKNVLPNVGREMDLQIKNQRTPMMISLKRRVSRHIIIKLSKFTDKES